MKSTNRRTVKHAIVMTEANYTGLLEYLEQKGYLVDVTATCLDDTVLEPDAPRELLDYSNAFSRRIKRLVIRSKPYSIRMFKDSDNLPFEDRYKELERREKEVGRMNNETFKITFYNGFFDPCEIEVSSLSDDAGHAVIRDIERRCLEMKPYYSVFANYRIVPAALGFAGLVAVVAILIMADSGTSNKSPNSISDSLATIIVLGLAGSGLMFGLSSAMEFFRKLLFPSFMFLIGKEIERNALLSHWRKWILGIFLAPLITGIIAFLFTKMN